MNARYFCFCQISDLLDAEPSLREARQHLHKFPELSFQEKSTAQWVGDRLEGWGYRVTRNVGGHGLVATLQNGAGRGIALRADMDALPIHEETGKPYASAHAGTMHACGHEGHTAMLMGAAQQLAKPRQFQGTVHLVFQPAEEAGKNSGAQQMIADGLFERFPCDAIFGMHNLPGAAQGTFMFGKGAFMSASDNCRIKVIGRGGHAARPHQAVETIGSVHAGQASNVIPEHATLGLSIRSFSPEVRNRLQERITHLVRDQVSSYGGEVEMEYERGYPVVINSDAETDFARQVAEELVGPEQVVFPFGPVTGSEDFAYYLQHKPGSFLRLGNGLDSVMLHNAKYDFNDANLSVGAAYWTRLVERFLNEPA